MKKLISFFEIPSKDFNRAVGFYSKILDVKLTSCECTEEKMAFFPKDNNGVYGAVIHCEGYEPSKNGVLISFSGGEDLSIILRKVDENRGKTLIPKTKIQADGAGYFGVFMDTEGNRIGLHSEG